MMKKIIYFLLLGVIGLVTSCSKTISVDTPLPLVRKDALLIPTNGQKMYCIDPNSGEKRWEFIASGNFLSNPIVYDDVAYLSSSNGIYAVDMFTGKQKWSKFYNNIEHPLTLDEKRLYFSTRSAGDSFYCVDLNGTRVWSYREASMAGSSVAPTIAKGCIYYATSNGRVYCLNKNTGALAIHSTVNYFSNPFVAGTNILGSPQFFNDSLYVVADAKVVCLNDSLKRTTVTPGGTPLIWNYNVGGVVTSSPLVYGYMCVVGGEDQNVHCIDAKAGVSGFRWKYATKDRVRGSATVDKKRENIIIGSNDFNLYAIDFVTGSLRWKFPMGSMMQNSPIIDNDRVYFTSVDKNLYCVNAENGSLIWKYNLNNTCEASPMIYKADNTCICPAESGNSAN